MIWTIDCVAFSIFLFYFFTVSPLSYIMYSLAKILDSACVCQCYAEKQALGEVSQELLDTQVNPAAWEISGHIVLKRRKDFEEAPEEYAWRVLSEVSLSEERFQEVKAYVLEAVGLQKPILEENGIIQEEDSLDKLPALEAQRVVQNCTVQH